MLTHSPSLPAKTRRQPRRLFGPLGGLGLLGLLVLSCGADPIQYLDGNAPGATTDLPCNVSQVLQTYCLTCHGSPPSGAPISLASYQDLTAVSTTDPTKKVIERAVLRMQAPVSPMPPGAAPSVPAAQVAVLQSFISAGLPAGGSCQNSAVTQCSSGQTWTRGSSGSPNMHPGRSCIACHANSGGEAPTFQIAGTVYPTAQEAYDCLGVNGSAAGVTVQITDAVGKVISLPVNSSGNFYYSGRAGALTLPYHAKVLAGGRERAMGAAQGTGDCNSCHSPTGQGGAPGRIMAP